MKAKSIKGTSPEEIQKALDEAMNDGFKPTFAAVFLSIKQDIKAICMILDKEEISIYGTTTDGEFIDSKLESGSIVILLLDIDKRFFRILIDDVHEEKYRDTTQELAKQALSFYTTPTFLIAVSGISTMPNLEQLLHGFEDIIPEVEVFGAIAGDDISLTKQYVFTNNNVKGNGIVAAVFDSKEVLVKGKAFCGWKPMGTLKTITKSDKNRVYEIDNESAKDFVMKYTGIHDLPSDPTEQGTLLNQTFSFQLQRDKGEPVMRNMWFDRDDGSFLCMGTIPVGSKVKLSIPPDFEVKDEIARNMEELKMNDIPEADAVLVYSCTGRFMTFGPTINDEIEEIRKVWNAPMAGFFGNGEIARATGGKLELHNLTACCVAIKEK